MGDQARFGPRRTRGWVLTEAIDESSPQVRLSLTAALATLAICAAPSSAIVGGHDAAPGEYPSVAEITFGAFGCTGTLISPDTVLSAGHCGSLTGAAVGLPGGLPAQLIDVTIGSYRSGDGENVPVSKVTVSPDYLLSDGNDISVAQALAQRHQGPDQGRRCR